MNTLRFTLGRRALHMLGAGLLALSVTACGSSTTAGTSASVSDAATSADQPAASAPLTLVDGWAKSTDSMPAEFKTMTGVFGTLKNSGSTPLTITAGSSPAGAMVQMHETVKTASGAMQMQEAKGGFTIPAGGSLELQPGANHIMIMNLTQDLKVGDDVTIDLTTSAGKVTITAAVRAFPGAGETYNPSPSASMSH